MTFTQAVSSVLSKYATFRGRAPRSEYWWFMLFCMVVPWAVSLISAVFFSDVFYVEVGEAHGQPLGLDAFVALFTLFTFIPSLAVTVRRFHDMDHTGWWLLLAFTGIGTIVVFFWLMFRGTTGPNRFGPDPLAT